MCQQLLHIYGPFSIQMYGLMLFIGLILSIVFLICDPLTKKLVTQQQLLDGIAVAIFSGLFGARILYLLFNYEKLKSAWNMLAVWDGGLSLLGAVIGAVIGLFFYLGKQYIPKLKFFDLLALYAPLLQSFGRVGCFFAGCCYGITTFPLQLYSAGLLFLIFLFMQLFVRRFFKEPGQTVSFYLILIGFERFFTDFLRGDREFLEWNSLSYFSVHQYIAIVMIVCGVCLFSFISKKRSA